MFHLKTQPIMKKHLFFALILFLAMPAMAQQASSAKVRHGGGPHPQNTTLTVVAERHQSFWLYVDDVLQNEQPVRSICIRNLWDDSFYIRVELNNQMQNCVGQFVDLRQSQTLGVVHAGKYYGLEYTQSHVRPELTMDLITAQVPVVPNITLVEPPIPPVSHGMSPKDYDDAHRMISNEKFDSTKLNMAKQVVASNPMTAAQIANICKLFSFENNKLEFAKYAYTFCTEKNKYYLLNEVFTYDSSKTELNEYINGL